MQLEEVRVTLANGDVHRVSITNRAEIAFEKEAALRKWPESETLSRTYQAWWELAKLSKTLDCTFDDFSTTLCLEVAPYISEARLEALVVKDEMPQVIADELRADGLVLDEEVVVDPTQPGLLSDEEST